MRDGPAHLPPPRRVEQGLDDAALLFEDVVVPAHGQGEALARQVPELRVAAPAVADVTPHRLPVPGVGEHEAEAVADVVAEVVRAGHAPNGARPQDAAGEQRPSPAGQRRDVAGQCAGRGGATGPRRGRNVGEPSWTSTGSLSPCGYQYGWTSGRCGRSSGWNASPS